MTRIPRTSRNPPYSDNSGTFAGSGGVLLALLAALAAGALGCGGSEPGPTSPPAARVVGAGARRVVLSAEAERRLGITTALVRRADRGNARAVIPFAALLYDAHGRAFTLVASRGRGFARRRVGVTAIDGGRVTLSRGPHPGARVVTTGANELLGAQQGVQAQ